MYRTACVEEFELVLDQSGKLLRKRLVLWFASNQPVDRLAFKGHAHNAAKHELNNLDAADRWIEYLENHSETAHDYGEGLADNTLKLLPNFAADAKTLADTNPSFPSSSMPAIGHDSRQAFVARPKAPRL